MNANQKPDKTAKAHKKAHSREKSGRKPLVRRKEWCIGRAIEAVLAAFKCGDGRRKGRAVAVERKAESERRRSRRVIRLVNSGSSSAGDLAGLNIAGDLHGDKLSSGVIEQIRPHIYWNDNGECHARFVVSSFSDFALVEYSFGFGTDALTKYTDSEPFTLKASGNAEGSTVRYESSAPEVAGVDENGLVTIEKDKFSALEDLKVS